MGNTGNCYNTGANDQFSELESKNVNTIETNEADLNGEGTYYGPTNNGIPAGFGRAEMNDGTRIEGTWNNGNLSDGNVYYPNGDQYSGNIRNYKANGLGKYTTHDGNRWEGMMKDDLMNGEGLMQYANGGQYKGQMKDNLMHGKGTFTFANRNRFQGMFDFGVNKLDLKF